MAGWRELPQLLVPRVQEALRRMESIDLRFDNDLYVRITRFRGGMLGLSFALFENANRTVLRFPMTEAARYIGGNLGYESVLVAGNPTHLKKSTAGAEAGLDRLKGQLCAKRGMMFILAARKSPNNEENLTWNAGANFQVGGEFRGPFRRWDYSRVARNIIETIDDLRQLLIDSIAESHAPAIQPR